MLHGKNHEIYRGDILLILGCQFRHENLCLNNIEGFQDENADLTITINRSDLDLVMMGVKTLDDMFADGTAKTKGDVSVIEKLKSTLIHFDLRLEVLPGTVPVGDQQFNRNPFQQPMPAVIGAD